MDPEFELEDTGIFKERKYFDIFAEYAKNDVDDILIRVRIVNRGPDKAELTFLPTLWFRNTWCWSKTPPEDKPRLAKQGDRAISAVHPELGNFTLTCDGTPEMLFTENETNTERIFGWRGENTFYKDAFHEYIIHGKKMRLILNRKEPKLVLFIDCRLRGRTRLSCIFVWRATVRRS